MDASCSPCLRINEITIKYIRSAVVDRSTGSNVSEIYHKRILSRPVDIGAGNRRTSKIDVFDMAFHSRDLPAISDHLGFPYITMVTSLLGER